MTLRKRGVLIVVLLVLCLFLVSCSGYGGSSIFNSLGNTMNKVFDTFVHFGKSVSKIGDRELAAFLRVILSVAIAIILSFVGTRLKFPRNISIAIGIILALLFFVFTPETMLIALGWIGKGGALSW